MSIRHRLALSFALAASAGPARAFTRETTRPGHPDQGVCLAWPTPSRQLTFRVNTAGAAHVPCQGAAAEQAVADAFATWAGATRTGEGAPCTDVAFVKGPATTVQKVGRDGVNLVVFRNSRCADVFTLGACDLNVPGDCAAKLNCWENDVGTLGLTTTSFDPDTGELFEADMELFAWDGVRSYGAYFTCLTPTAERCLPPVYGKPGCNAVDLQAVATHEAGHVLGLDHVCSNEGADAYKACPGDKAVMAPTVGDVGQRALSQDDVAGACTLYPKGAASLTCASAKPAAKGGCSTGGGAGISALLAAAAAAWRSRRRRG